MYDSVYVFAKGLAAMDSGHSIKPTNLSCDTEESWDDGLSLYNYLDSVVSCLFAPSLVSTGQTFDRIRTWSNYFPKK